MPDETFAVYDSMGGLLSTGTVIANPLPSGLIARPLTETEIDAMNAGALWNPTTLTFDDPPFVPPYPALEPAGSLATLLVVEEMLPIEDAARSVRATPDWLIHEATAWSLAN